MAELDRAKDLILSYYMDSHDLEVLAEIVEGRVLNDCEEIMKTDYDKSLGR